MSSPLNEDEKVWPKQNSPAVGSMKEGGVSVAALAKLIELPLSHYG